MSTPLIGGGGSQTIAALPEEPPLEPGTPAARAFFDSHRTYALNVGEEFFTTMGIPMLRGRAHGSHGYRRGAAGGCHQPFAGTATVWDDRRARPALQDRAEAKCSVERSHRRVRRCQVHVATARRAADGVLQLSPAIGANGDVRAQDGRRTADGRDCRCARHSASWILRCRCSPCGRRKCRSSRIVRRESLMARLATMLGLVTLVLSAIGLFGLLAGEVARRTPEIGLRMALGAERAHVRWMVIRQSLLVVAAGLLLGIPAAIGGTRVLTGTVFGLSPADPGSLALAAAAYRDGRRGGRLPARPSRIARRPRRSPCGWSKRGSAVRGIEEASLQTSFTSAPTSTSQLQPSELQLSAFLGTTISSHSSALDRATTATTGSVSLRL